MKNFFSFLTWGLLVLNSSWLWAQSYIDDTVAVRAILDSNRLIAYSVDLVTDSSGGRIVSLYLGHCTMPRIPDDIGRLTALKRCYLCIVKATYISPAIGNCTQLDSLHLYDNSLDSVPSTIGNLKSLKVLDLRQNRLASLPLTITELKPSTICDISYNKLDSTKLHRTILQWADKYDPDWRLTQSPDAIILSPVYNKPFALKVDGNCLEFFLDSPAEPAIRFFSMQGRSVWSFSGGFCRQGANSIPLDRYHLPSGNYLLRMQSGQSEYTGIVLKLQQ